MTVLTEGALYETCRALADRGTDYGWNVYYRGTRIPPASAAKLVRDEEAAADWLLAFRAALKAYRDATGKAWAY